MPDVLLMPALQFGHPVVSFIQMIINNLPQDPG
jgi:hypothetical protein